MIGEAVDAALLVADALAVWVLLLAVVGTSVVYAVVVGGWLVWRGGEADDAPPLGGEKGPGRLCERRSPRERPSLAPPRRSALYAPLGAPVRRREALRGRLRRAAGPEPTEPRSRPTKPPQAPYSPAKEHQMTDPYRVLVTGSRNWQTIGTVRGALAEILASLPDDQPLVVVHGDCVTGADIMAKAWALTTFTSRCTDDYEHVTEEAHPAAWHVHGNAAGPIRNKAMVDKGADVCLAFIRDGSRGASHTADLAEKAGIPTRRFTA